MKKQILLALPVVVAVVLPLAAATKNSGTSKNSSEPRKSTAVASPDPAEKSHLQNAVTPVASPAKKKAAGPAPVIKGNGIRRLPAKQSRARQLMADLTETQREKLLAFLNEASVKELDAIHGVSTVRGAAIEKARPFSGIDEVILVSGVGEGTFGEIVKHGKTLTLNRTTSGGDRPKSAVRKSS